MEASFLVDSAYYSGLCLLLVGLFFWGYQLLTDDGEEASAKRALEKLNGHEVTATVQEAFISPDELPRRSTASGFLEPPATEEVTPQRALCGIGMAPSSAPLTVEKFGECLQRMIRACHYRQGGPRLRIFDDSTVSDQIEGSAVTLTECRCTQFKRLRTVAHLSEERYMNSMCAEAFSGGKIEASGKSGSFFLRTHDGKFVLKTIEEHEFNVLRDILPHMILYLMEHQRSLLCRFLGAYSLDIGGKKLRFVVMANVLPRHADEVYDLKGTTEDRWVEPSTGGVMKDNNFHFNSMFFGAELCAELQQQIRDDAEFLYSLGVMDYSLLVGISPSSHGEEAELPEGLTVTHGWMSTKGGRATPRVFQLGIIDYLQRWTPKKVAAHWLKKSTLGCFHEIDTEPPAVYCNRFYKYLWSKMQIMNR